MSTLTFTGRTQASKRRNAFDIAYENGFVNSEEDYAASLDGIDMKLSSDNYIRNLRLTGNNLITVEMVLSGLNEEGTLTVTCSDSTTRNLIVAVNGTSITPTDEVEGLQKGDNVTVQIPYNARYDVTLTMVSSDTDVKTITAVDETKYDHDFGTCSAVPVKYVEAGVDHFVISGDYFVASDDFSTYAKGVPYKFNGTNWVEMQANLEDADRMLHALGSVLNDSSVTVPSTSAIYGWFQNLVAQNGFFESLAANVAFIMALITKNITVGTYGTGFCFRALSDDGNGDKVFDVTYNGNELFKVDIDSGKIYFGTGFWYDPTDSGIHSTNDKVIIDSLGAITVNEGLYKSDLKCPSFRSLPRENIISPIVISNPASAEALYNSLISNGITTEDVYYPCNISTDSRVKFLTYDRIATSSQNRWVWACYNSSLTKLYEGVYRSGSTYGWSALYINSNSVITIGSASSTVFKFLTLNDTLSIPDNVQISQLGTGELYYVPDSGGTTGTIHVKL